jgi:Zn-dependent protease with chaperone function
MKRASLRFIGKIGIVCLMICGGDQLSNAQSFNKDYKTLQSSGTLPEVFLKSARAQSAYELAIIPLQKDKIEKEQFIKANNYFIEDLLLSGQVLVNDPLTMYVNKVAAEVIKQNPAVGMQSVQLFVTRSPEVNAYAFDRGLIFVNIGLLAQLENEAQLAYILSHELLHVSKKHSVTEYLKNQQTGGKNRYTDDEEEDLLLAQYRFSKEQEREADVEGLQLIKNTNYSVKAVIGAFDVMQYSYLPFELPEFKKSFFEDDYFKIPDTLNLKKVDVIRTADDYNDSKSTHPNIRKRRLSIADDVKSIDESGRKKYLISEENFKTMRETARFELCRIYLLKRDYTNAIYAAYILLQKYPDNIYLKRIVGKGLYNIAINKADKTSENVIKISNGSSYSVNDYRTIEGESQRLYYLFENLSGKEMNVMALCYAYKIAKQYPGDPTFSILKDSLLSCLVNNNGLNLNDFLKKTDTVNTVVEEPVEESKYTTIKKMQEIVEPIDSNFMTNAIWSLLKEEDFVKRYEKIAEHTEEETSKDGTAKEDEMLGVEKVIFIDPQYRRVMEDKDEEEIIKYEESEEQQLKLMDIQKKCAEKLSLGYVSIGTKHLTATDIEMYNESALINDWLTERLRHKDKEEMMECTESIKDIINKRGTKYIVLNGVYNYNVKHSVYFFMLLNLETGKILRTETKQEDEKDSDELLNEYVYNSLMHVTKKPKKQ